MEATLAAAGIGLDQIHHGDGIASWAVNRRAVARGHGIRTGLEDTPCSRTAARRRATASWWPPPRRC